MKKGGFRLNIRKKFCTLRLWHTLDLTNIQVTLSVPWVTLLSKCCHRKWEMVSVAPTPTSIQRQGNYGKGTRHYEISSCHWFHCRRMSVLLKPCNSAFPCMKLEYIFWEDWFQLLTYSLELSLLSELCHWLFVCSNKLLRLPATGSSAAVLHRKKCQSLLAFLYSYLLDKTAICSVSCSSSPGPRCYWSNEVIEQQGGQTSHFHVK